MSWNSPIRYGFGIYPSWRNGRPLSKDTKFLKENFLSSKGADFLLPSLSLKAPVLRARMNTRRGLEVEVATDRWANRSSNRAVIDDASSIPNACHFIPIYAGRSSDLRRKWRDKQCAGLLVERAELAGGRIAHRRLGAGCIYYSTREGWERKNYHRMILQSPISEVLLV